MSRERQFDIEDNRSQLHVTGSRQALKLPSGLALWNPKKPGSYRLEFIPFNVTENHNKFLSELRYSRPGKWYPERTYFAHFGIGVDNASYTCALKTFGKSCPMCEARARLTKSPHKEDEERANSLRPRERQLYLVMERNDRGELDREIKLWEVSFHNWGENLQKYIEAADVEDRDAFKRYYHPVHGYTIKVAASEETMGKGANKFLEFSVHEFKARREPLDDEIFDHGFDLDDMIRVVDYETLRDIFQCTGGADDPPPAERRSESNPSTGNGRGGYGDSRGRDNPEPRGRTSEPEVAPRSRAAQPEPDPFDAPPAPRAARPAPPPDPEPAPLPRGRAVLPPPEPISSGVEYATGDVVAFKYRGKPMEGTVRRVRDKIAHVVVEGFDREVVMDFDELTMIRADDTFDAKPAARPAPEPEPAPVPRTRAKTPASAEPEPEPAPAPRGRGRPPATKPAESEPSAAPARGAAKSKWDDDDDGAVAFQRKK